VSIFIAGPCAGRRARGVITTAAALTAAAAVLASPAGAVVADPHVVAAIPDASALELSGYPANRSLTIQALRNGVVIGTATGTTSAGNGTARDPGGDLTVNPSVCWAGSTPQLLPGDTIRVTGAGTDEMTVADIEATSSGQDLNGDIVVHGFAKAANGGPLDAATFAAGVQARLTITGDLFDFNGRNSLRAGATKTDGTIAYDAPSLNDPNPTTWTARFHLTTAADVARALGNKNVEGVFLIGLSELTIGRTPVGAPGPGCPPVQRNGVTSFGGRTAVNVSNARTPLAVSGAAQADVSDVAVTLTDHNGRSMTYPGVAPSGGTWTTAGLDVSGLADGTLTATPTMTSASLGTFDGATRDIPKDTVAPPAPVSSVPPGRYTSAKSVSLGDDDPTATVHFTLAGTTPTADSPAFTSPIAVADTMTINAVAVDPAGNTSPKSSFAFTIGPPAPGPAGSGTGPGVGVARDTPAPAPAATGLVPGLGVAPVGPAPAPLPLVQLPGTSPARSGVKGLAVTHATRASLGRSGLRVSMQLPSGTRVVSLRIFRLRGGRASAGPLLSTVRTATKAGRYTVTLRGAAIRRLRAGRYLLQVRAGNTPQSLAGVVSRTFTVG
jgi:hypothetical protein